MSTELAKNERRVALPVNKTIQDLGALIMRHKDRILDALPRGVDGEAVLKKSIMAVRKSPYLLKCTPASLFYAISEAVANGLEIGGNRNHCYLVPYGTECTLMLGYKGMVELVRRTGQLESASLNLVHEGDVWEYEEGDHPRLRHVPSADPDAQSRPVTHVYVVFRLKGDVIVRNVWTAGRVCAHRDQYSEAYRNAEAYRIAQEKAKKPVEQKKLSAWHTSWHNQAFKTLIRDLFNRGLLPISEDIQVAIERDSYVEQAKAPRITRDRSLDDMLAGIAAEESGGSQPLISSQSQDYELDGTPVTKEAVEVTQQEQQVSLEIQLERATSLGAVTAIREHALDGEQDEDQRAYVIQACNEREAQIRESRSEK